MGEREFAKPEYSPRKSYPLKPARNADETRRNLAALLTGPETAACRVITGVERSSGVGEQLDVPSRPPTRAQRAALLCVPVSRRADGALG